MSAAFFLQLKQMLGGKRALLVLAALLLPLGLALVARRAGGFEDQAEALVVPAGMEGPIDVGGLREPLELLPDSLVIRGGRLLFNDHDMTAGSFRVDNEGRPYVIVRDQKMWIDRSNRPRPEARELSFHFSQGPSLEGPLPQGIFLFLLYPQMLGSLLALFYGASLLGNELDNKTITYLFTRPVSRFRLILGQYLAIIAVLLPPCLSSLALAWVILNQPGELRLLGALSAALVGGLCAYNAIFILIGYIVPRRAIVVTLIYAVVFEFFLSFIPALVNTASITYYTRSLAVSLAGLEVPKEIERVVGGATAGQSVLALLIMIGIGLSASAWLASRREYLLSDAN